MNMSCCIGEDVLVFFGRTVNESARTLPGHPVFYLHTIPTIIQPIMRIITPGSIFRDWKLSDAELLAMHADNPRIAANMRDAFPSPYTRADA